MHVCESALLTLGGVTLSPRVHPLLPPLKDDGLLDFLEGSWTEVRATFNCVSGVLGTGWG